MAHDNIGPHRVVVGAHYGLWDWIGQRVSALVMAVYTIILVVTFLCGHNFSYEGWAGMFAMPWFKVTTFVSLMALLYHAWVGVRDIWMDYAKPTSVRLAFHIATILWLVGCAVWAAQILWRA